MGLNDSRVIDDDKDQFWMKNLFNLGVYYFIKSHLLVFCHFLYIHGDYGSVSGKSTTFVQMRYNQHYYPSSHYYYHNSFVGRKRKTLLFSNAFLRKNQNIKYFPTQIIMSYFLQILATMVQTQVSQSLMRFTLHLYRLKHMYKHMNNNMACLLVTLLLEMLTLMFQPQT